MNNQNNQITSPISRFTEYTDEILRFFEELCKSNISNTALDNIPFHLNGKASIELKRLIPFNILKKNGIFFTGSNLSNIVAAKISGIIKNGGKVLDPACGAGDLLLACANFLSLKEDYEKTLELWSTRLFGYDLHPPFIAATKLRLALLAAQRYSIHGNNVVINNINSIFKGLHVHDFLKKDDFQNDFDCVIVNPPFGYSKAPKNCHWASGKVQSAALFIEQLLKNSHKNQQIVAILPDVLRSGSRYEKWRQLVQNYSKKLEVEIFGRFDSSTDVDVFILNILVCKSRSNKIAHKWQQLVSNGNLAKISNEFEVRVGPVVPHRDPKKGPRFRYLDCNSALPWSEIDKLKNRRFSGTTFKPPFVVLRRTSSPSDKNRVIATLVKGSSPVAVENHLIVLIPKDSTVKTCKSLIANFKRNETKDWLNTRIRCRHLTVSALKELPWWE